MKFILSCWDVLLVTQEQKSMSQNGDPTMATFMGIYSIDGPDVGFIGGVAYIYICIHMYIYIYIYIYTLCITAMLLRMTPTLGPPPDALSRHV